ncbi:MAG: hypothetical protein AB3N18_12290 [Allomuricauda sp.]
MLKFITRIAIYGLFIFLALELLVRLFHLYNDMPDWYLAEDNTYKRVPGQVGYAVYGNRKQKASQYRINQAGYNSFREFDPTEEGIEVAILGDSFIEGLHQDYRNSIGKKIERQLEDIHVYEYGHSNFDMADLMFLAQANKADFDKIDLIIFEFKFGDDLLRNEYKLEQRKVVFPLLRRSKLLTYLLDIGMVDPVKRFLRKLNIGQAPRTQAEYNKDVTYLNNFKQLIDRYGIDKSKTVILLDTRKTPNIFLEFLQRENIDMIDYGATFENSKDMHTTLVFDQHWNDHGRNLIAIEIVNYLKKTKKLNRL